MYYTVSMSLIAFLPVIKAADTNAKKGTSTRNWKISATTNCAVIKAL